MTGLRRVLIEDGVGGTLSVELDFDGEREATTPIIDGVYYHFERIGRDVLVSDYRVDLDPDYMPHTDASGNCYILAPYSE